MVNPAVVDNAVFDCNAQKRRFFCGLVGNIVIKKSTVSYGSGRLEVSDVFI